MGSATASRLSGWLAAGLLCASILLLGWSFYNVYGRGMKTRTTLVITWLALAFVVGFWTWHLAFRG